MSFWGRIIHTLLAIESRASSASRTPRAFLPRGQKLRLEDRALLTVTASFIDGQLAVVSDWKDEIVVDVESGYVKVNGADFARSTSTWRVDGRKCQHRRRRKYLGAAAPLSYHD